MPNFIKIRPVGAELFHTDADRHMTKLMAAFRNSVKAPRNGYLAVYEIITGNTKYILLTEMYNNSNTSSNKRKLQEMRRG
jgi:hypothetical protein